MSKIQNLVKSITLTKPEQLLILEKYHLGNLTIVDSCTQMFAGDTSKTAKNAFATMYKQASKTIEAITGTEKQSQRGMVYYETNILEEYAKLRKTELAKIAKTV